MSIVMAFPEQFSRSDDEELVLDPRRLLVAFAEPMADDEVRELVRGFGLRLEGEDPSRSGEGDGRDEGEEGNERSEGDGDDEGDEGRDEEQPDGEPMADPGPIDGPTINHTGRRYWVRADEDIPEDVIDGLLDRAAVEWVGPVYRRSADSDSAASVLPHVLLVRFAEGKADRLDDLLERYDLTFDEERHVELDPFYRLELSASALEEAGHAVALREDLLAEEGVDDVRFSTMPMESPVLQGVPAFTPNDDFFGQQWNMTRIDAPRGWRLGTGDASVVVAVLDTGCDVGDPGDPSDTGHPDLNFDGPGYNAETGANDGRPATTSQRGHGTAVAGIASGMIDNARGVAGVAGDCEIHAVAIPNWEDDEVKDAILHAATIGADVANMSFGDKGDWWDEGLIDPAITTAHTNDVVLCAASGNDDNAIEGGPLYPSRHPDVVCVGASDRNDQRKRPASPDGECWGSNWGDELDVVAPGVQCWTADIRGTNGYNSNGGGSVSWACVNYPSSGSADGDYLSVFDGTSAATPHVAGLAGLLRSLDAGLGNEEIRDIVERTCDKVGGYAYATEPGRPNGTWHDQMGYGRINVFDALSEILSVELTTPALTWEDQLPDYTTARAAVFDVVAPMEVHLNVSSPPAPDPPFDLVAADSDTVGPTGGATEEGRILVFYTGTTTGTVDTGTVQIACPETGQEWTVSLTGDTSGRNAAGVSLVLDRSGSMAGSSNVDDGTGTVLTRIDLLKRSIDPLLNLLRKQDGIGAVAFSSSVSVLTSLQLAGPPGSSGTGRDLTESAIDGLTPGGLTSIGEGLIEGDALFDASGAPDFGDPNEAVIVFTDGHENPAAGTRSLSHPEVQNAIDSRVFAVGMGTSAALDPTKLIQITDGQEGYMMMTGNLATTDRYLLTKYFLQILTDATNADIVTDPGAFVAPGDEHRIPFTLARADVEGDVILLTPPWRGLFDLRLETPHGDVVDPGTASSHPQVTYVEEETCTYYRLSLPTTIDGRESREGTWHALISLDEGQLEEYLAERQIDRRRREGLLARGMPYSLNVHARSNLRLSTALSQDSLEPGATVTLRAVLTEYDLPVEGRATVEAEVSRPDGTSSTLSLSEVDPGVFETSFPAPMPGQYPARVRAEGRSMHDRRFTREALRTAAVWRGGDTVEPTQPPVDTDVPGERLCDLLECLVDDAFRDTLEEMNVDVGALRRCLARYCREDRAEPEPDDGMPEDEIRRILDDRRLRESIATLGERFPSLRRGGGSD